MATYASSTNPFIKPSSSQGDESDIIKSSHLVDAINEDEEDQDQDETNTVAPMEQDIRQHKHIELIKKLRLQLKDLERYAYERGELDHLPPSVLAERQTVILEALKDKLSLNITSDEIEKLNLNELKKQVDKEIQDLIDPLLDKDRLLDQLQAQLKDLERYITHLHASLDKSGKTPSSPAGCSCQVHGCHSTSSLNSHLSASLDAADTSSDQLVKSTNNLMNSSNLMNNDALPKTSRLIRSLIAQLICADVKLHERSKDDPRSSQEVSPGGSQAEINKANGATCCSNPSDKKQQQQQFNDGAAWTLHIDKVILATDSLVNLYTLEPADRSLDESLIESVVRRQLIPALRDVLTYGLIELDDSSKQSSYASLFFDPYQLISSWICFPTSFKSNSSNNNNSDRPTAATNVTTDKSPPLEDKVHVWNVIEDYCKCRNEPSFKSSSIKTLSQSFNLAPSIDGPIKVTSKQALLIAVDDIVEILLKSKPNGPDSHLRLFIYTALNRSKLAHWVRLIFRSKSILRKFYHNYSFVNQQDKMEKLLATIEPLSQFAFKLPTDVESIEQFVSAF